MIGRPVHWLLLLSLPGGANADSLRDAVNGIRLHGCPAQALRKTLTASASLDLAADRMRKGSSLDAALKRAGYFAQHMSAVHLSGAVDEAAVRRALTAHECAALADPEVTEVGVARKGADVWLVFAAPAPIPSAGSEFMLAQRVVALTNQARADGHRCGKQFFPPAEPLRANTALSRAAATHAEAMAHGPFFDHRGRDGTTPSQRIERAGYGAYRIVGENIAAGAMSAEELVAGWLASPSHCENLMDPRFRDMGLGFGVNRDSEELVYWTQDFAAKR